MGVTFTLPAPFVEFEERLDKFMDEFNEAWTITSGVEVRGSAASYALVWEFG